MKKKRVPAECNNTKKIWFAGLIFIIIGLVSPDLSAMDPMGPPTAELEKDMFRGGIEYSIGDMDLKLKEGTAVIFRNGAPLGSGTVDSFTIKGFETNTLYATIGYGVFESCEAFVRMGMTNGSFGDSLWEEGEDFDSSSDLALGAGIKATFYKGFDWKIGGLIQVNKTEYEGQVDSSSWAIPQPQIAQISTTEMQVALGATYLYSSRVSVYAGPFAHFISGDFDYDFTRIVDTDFDTGNFSWEITEGPTYGGYLGAQLGIAKNVTGNIEYQHTSDANLFSINIMVKN